MGRNGISATIKGSSNLHGSEECYMGVIKDFCRDNCPFGQKDRDCQCIDENLKCPVDYFLKWLVRDKRDEQ
jgi:hypothetical protein